MDATRRQRLRHHLRLIDGGVAPVVAKYTAHIECRAGCNACCHQTFRISRLEGEYLRLGLATTAPDERADILAQARAYEPDAEGPCPVLSKAGHCRLYDHRPRICRKYGIPLWHPDRPHEVKTCPKNFRDVADIDAGMILDPQARWAEDWLRLEAELGPQTERNTIASWLRRLTPDEPDTT